MYSSRASIIEVRKAEQYRLSVRTEAQVKGCNGELTSGGYCFKCSILIKHRGTA